jgi:hypothetical protein
MTGHRYEQERKRQEEREEREIRRQEEREEREMKRQKEREKREREERERIRAEEKALWDAKEEAERKEREAARKGMEEEREVRSRSTAARTKTFGDAMRSAAIRMREEPLDAIPFFENVERLFAPLEVPVELQADLVHPYLSDRANKLVSQLEPSVTRDYTVVKRYILSQLRLSPRVLLDKFNTLVRGAEKTTVLFASRLKALLQYYLDSRKVKTFKDLFSLIVSDRIKSTLVEGCLNHVLSVESNTDSGWLNYDKLSDVIDTYYANRVDGKPVVAAIGYNGKNRQRGREGQGFRNDKSVVEQAVTEKGLSGKSVKARDASNMPGIAGKSCWSCGGPHLKKNCPTIGQSGDRSGYRAAGAQSRV